MKTNSSNSLVMWWIVVVYILHKDGKCMGTCPTVQQTAQQVPRCPVNESEWKTAALIKKCGELHSNCTSPERFKYHCALNYFRNESWEVCAPEKYLLGYCIEYNKLGDLIQDHYKRNCSAMNPPCPSRYLSTEAYKYQECYKTVQQSSEIYQTKILSSTHTTMLNDTNTRKNPKEIGIGMLIIGIAVPAAIFVFLIIGCVVWWWRKGDLRRKKKKEKEREEEELMNSIAKR